MTHESIFTSYKSSFPFSLTLAFSTGKRELETIAPDGSHKQKIIAGGEHGAADIFNPVWAPDSRAFTSRILNNLFQVSLSGAVLAKTSLAVIAKEKEAVTSADSFVPFSN